LVGLMMSLPVMTPSTLMSVCTDAITREWLDGFSWNLVWTLCHWCLV
jgi:hypothetical protein